MWMWGSTLVRMVVFLAVRLLQLLSFLRSLLSAFLLACLLCFFEILNCHSLHSIITVAFESFLNLNFLSSYESLPFRSANFCGK
jgi:hypothetical protein